MASTMLKFGILAASASQALASCAYGTLLHPRSPQGEVKVNTFGYMGANGPANWHSLDPVANALCANGTHQSPINMVAGNFSIIPAAELSLSLPDMTEGGEFENLGTTCEVVGGKGTLSFQNVTYTFKQFHFHLPSEHLDNGTSMAMEMHAVWQSEGGDIAVIGTFVDLEDDTTSKEASTGTSNQGPQGTSNGGTNPHGTSKNPVEEEQCDEPEATNTSNGSEDEEDCDNASSTSAVQPEATLRMGRRTALKAKFSRREISKLQAIGRRELPSTDGTFFHVNNPATAAVTHSDLLEIVLSSIDKIATPGTSTETEPLLMSDLVSVWNNGSFQTYEGSLTTPPCKEGVRWLVSDQKLSISTSAFLKARAVLGFNSRFPQNTLGEPNVLALGH